MEKRASVYDEYSKDCIIIGNKLYIALFWIKQHEGLK